jgi:hypothetical protein
MKHDRHHPDPKKARTRKPRPWSRNVHRMVFVGEVIYMPSDNVLSIFGHLYRQSFDHFAISDIKGRIDWINERLLPFTWGSGGVAYAYPQPCHCSDEDCSPSVGLGVVYPPGYCFEPSPGTVYTTEYGLV